MEKTLFIGEQAFDSADVRRIAGPAAAGSYYPSHWFADSPLPRNQAYVKAYRAKYNRDPDYAEASAAVSGAIFQLAVEAANSIDPKKVRDALGRLGEKALGLSMGDDVAAV